MSINDVVAQLRAGVPKEQLLAAVQHRHVTSLMVPETELEVAANGAGHQLISAMKDPRNLITASQEAAYMHLVAARPATGHGPTSKAPRAVAAR